MIRKLNEDVQDINRWKKCIRKQVILYVTYNTTGAVYSNRHDRTTSIANGKTPILVKDESENYWTVSVRTLKNEYVLPGGVEIDEEFIQELKSGEFFAVEPKMDTIYWCFHVDTDTYRWNCPYGANKANLPHGPGDYLVCRGQNKPDLRTIKAIHYNMFKRLYKEERSKAC